MSEVIVERVYIKGVYYERISSDPTVDDHCAGCVFAGDSGCEEVEANCMATGCGPTSIFKEVDDGAVHRGGR